MTRMLTRDQMRQMAARESVGAGPRAGGAVASSLSNPAPVKGWNARDPLDQLEPDEAIQMINWEAHANEVEFRYGSQSFMTGFPAGPVEFIREFNVNGTLKMIAAGGDAVCAITTAGVSTTLATGFSNARWQATMLSANMILVNGEDTPQLYDGSAFSDASFSGTAFVPEDQIGITQHGSRLYMWEPAQTWFWYGGTSAISGTVSKFDLKTVSRKGGTLVLVINWTRDGGDGVDDFIAFAMSSGEYIVYTGTNPGDANNWSLVGRFYGAPPLGIRSAVQYNGDAIILTRNGAMSLNAMLPFQGTRQSIALTDRIQKAWNSAVFSYAENYGWEATVYPQGPWLLCNIPILTPDPDPTNPVPVSSNQYVMNLDTGAWFQIQGWNARTFGTFNNGIYFGTNEQGVPWDTSPWNTSPWYGGMIAQGDIGTTDLGLNAGVPTQVAISGTLFTSFRDPTATPGQFQLKMVRPIFLVEDNITVNLAVAVDYGTANPTNVVMDTTNTSQSAWDTAQWNVAPWAGGERLFRNWIIAPARGMAVALVMRIVTTYQTPKFRGWDMSYEPGGLM